MSIWGYLDEIQTALYLMVDYALNNEKWKMNFS